jgi:hypothetical protein
MASASGQWVVHPHGPIEKIGPRVWRVVGNVPGMELKRVMTIARRDDDGLVVHNAIALEEPAMREIEAWGEISYVLVPNSMHRIDAAPFAKRYPGARVLCPRGSRAKIALVVPSVSDYAEFPDDAYVTLAVIDGVGEQEGVLTIRDASGTSLVITDTVFNMPHVSGVAGFVLRHVTASTGGPRISRLARWMLVKDPKALAAHLDRLADTPGLARVIVGHHEMITDAPGETLRALAKTL